MDSHLERARVLAAATLDARRDELGSDHPHLAPTLSALAGIFRRLVGNLFSRS